MLPASPQPDHAARPFAFLEPRLHRGPLIPPIVAELAHGIAPERVDSRTHDTGTFGRSATSFASRSRVLTLSSRQEYSDRLGRPPRIGSQGALRAGSYRGAR